MEKKDLVYIGTSYTIIPKIVKSKLFNLKHIICEEKRVSKKYISIVRELNLNFIVFKNKDEFIDIIQKNRCDNCIFLIYQFDYIVPSFFINRLKFFNLHAGNMKTNRGANPIIWSILNNDKFTELTLHQINEKIDLGVIIDSYKVTIDNEDDTNSLKMKMEEGIEFLLNRLYLYLNKEFNGTVIEDGIYRRKIKEIDYTIDISNDSIDLIDRKIRSQSQYSGAILNLEGKKYYLTKLLNHKKVENSNFNYQINKRVLIIEANNVSYSFLIKEKYEMD